MQPHLASRIQNLLRPNPIPHKIHKIIPTHHPIHPTPTPTPHLPPNSPLIKNKNPPRHLLNLHQNLPRNGPHPPHSLQRAYLHLHALLDRRPAIRIRNHAVSGEVDDGA